jgi:hemerythrin
MAVIWQTRYDTGIQVVDDQHQELFGLVERLRLSVQESLPAEETQVILEELVVATEQHFTTEEAIMAKAQYPDLTQHVAEHASMLTSLYELRTKFRQNPLALALMVPTFMDGWLKHHISDGDFGFVTFLKARRLL